jgi:hypothetical protein
MQFTQETGLFPTNATKLQNAGLGYAAAAVSFTAVRVPNPPAHISRQLLPDSNPTTSLLSNCRLMETVSRRDVIGHCGGWWTITRARTEAQLTSIDVRTR